MTNHSTLPKMSRKQAKILWDNLSAEQKAKFNEMYAKLSAGKLMLTNVCVDDNEEIQRIILNDKDKPSAPTAPFAKNFNLTD